MDERTVLFLGVLGSVGFFAVVAGLFGALSGALSWRDGRASGTVLGLSVARAFSRAAENKLSTTTLGALVGGTDGCVFGALVGTLVGWCTRAEWQTLRPIFLTSVLLVVAAILFGLAAVGLRITGTKAIVGLFVGGLAGALEGFHIRALDGLIVGTLLGGVCGALVFTLTFRWRK